MRIFEIFNSIDGEVNYFGQGVFSTFIRFSGCNLNCNWCDTEDAQDAESGKEMSVQEVIDKVERIGCKKVTITGGEPLLQSDDFYKLVSKLSANNYLISVETNGSFVPRMDYNVDSWVVDYKLPSSGMNNQMMSDVYFLQLNCTDYIKFVISDYEDYIFAKEKYKIFREGGAAMAFSPIIKNLNVKHLMGWMQEDKLFDVLLNIQIHKILKIK